MWDNDGVMSGWFTNFYPRLCGWKNWEQIEEVSHGNEGWHFYRRHGMEDAEFVTWLNQYAEEGGFAEQEIYPGVREAVIQIKAHGHTQHLVTDRPAIAEADTAWWLDEYCPEMDTLTVSRDKTVFKEYGPPTYFAIDDRIDNVATLRKASVYAYLLTRPWNEDSDLPRVATVQEFADIVCGR